MLYGYLSFAVGSLHQECQPYQLRQPYFPSITIKSFSAAGQRRQPCTRAGRSRSLGMLRSVSTTTPDHTLIPQTKKSELLLGINIQQERPAVAAISSLMPRKTGIVTSKEQSEGSPQGRPRIFRNSMPYSPGASPGRRVARFGPVKSNVLVQVRRRLLPTLAVAEPVLRAVGIVVQPPRHRWFHRLAVARAADTSRLRDDAGVQRRGRDDRYDNSRPF